MALSFFFVCVVPADLKAKDSKLNDLPFSDTEQHICFNNRNRKNKNSFASAIWISVTLLIYLLGLLTCSDVIYISLISI